MKTGILTFHDGPNHGAFLQAYATMKQLQKWGVDARIINYKNRIHRRQEGLRILLRMRNPLTIVDALLKFYEFRKAHALFRQTPFTTNPSVVRKMAFDAVVVGSDIVWNYKLFGFDDLFFGNLNADVKVAYAASFGAVDANETILPEAEKGLRRFDHIAVRDKNSQQIVERCCGRRPPVVADPVFLHDFSDLEQATQRTERQKPYILIYAFRMLPEEIEEVTSFAREQGLPTLSVGYRQKWCDHVLLGVGPAEWLAFFSKATYVVTSTFHGTIMALKMKKQFSVSMNTAIRNKAVSLLTPLGLGDRVMSADNSAADILPREIDYQRVDEKLEAFVEASRSYLKNALNA